MYLKGEVFLYLTFSYIDIKSSYYQIKALKDLSEAEVKFKALKNTFKPVKRLLIFL